MVGAVLRLLHGVTAHARIWAAKVVGMNPSFFISSLRTSNAAKALNRDIHDGSCSSKDWHATEICHLKSCILSEILLIT